MEQYSKFDDRSFPECLEPSRHSGSDSYSICSELLRLLWRVMGTLLLPQRIDSITRGGGRGGQE
eukprot:2470060-Pyramimonas_sp.AAC.1